MSIYDTDALFDRIIEKITEALDLFGSYPFIDKGPHEVMDVNVLVKELITLPYADVRRILVRVLDKEPSSPKARDSGVYERFVIAALEEIEGLNGAMLELVITEPKLGGLYG